MTTRTTQRTQTSGWQTSLSASSASTFSVRTDDPSLSTTLAPNLTVMLGFGKQPGLRAVSKQLMSPTAAPRRENGSSEVIVADDVNTPDPTAVEHSSSSAADADSGAIDLPHTDDSGLSSGENAAHSAFGSSERRARGEKHARLVDPEPEPDAAVTAEPEHNGHATAEAARPAHPHRIEMTIDSLPHHDLTEPIPIYIDPLGDTVFTATLANLDVMATGNSIGEALVLLKEQIEFIYNDLNRRQKRSPDQTTMLQMLHTYIAPSGAKPSWL